MPIPPVWRARIVFAQVQRDSERLDQERREARQIPGMQVSLPPTAAAASQRLRRRLQRVQRVEDAIARLEAQLAALREERRLEQEERRLDEGEDDPHSHNRPLSLGARPLEPNVSLRYDAGLCNIVCGKCSAHHWLKERAKGTTGSGENSSDRNALFMACCQNGAAELPELQAVDSFLEELMTAQTTRASLRCRPFGHQAHSGRGEKFPEQPAQLQQRACAVVGQGQAGPQRLRAARHPRLPHLGRATDPRRLAPPRQRVSGPGVRADLPLRHRRRGAGRRAPRPPPPRRRQHRP
jgi:hypothetical protein